MRCYICDGPLSNDEIKHEPHYGKGDFAPCGRCLEVINELFNDDSDDEIAEQLTAEAELLEENFESADTLEDFTSALMESLTAKLHANIDEIFKQNK